MAVDLASTPIFTIQSDSECQSECHAVAVKQQSDCSASSHSSYNSSSSNCTGDSLDSVSSITLSLIDAPPGPFSALDFSSEGRILCFDEKTNRIVSIDLLSNGRHYFAVPLEFEFQYYYWSHIVAIDKAMILALLKKHKSRHFYLVTFSLLVDSAIATEITRMRTKIRSEGYQVSCQRLDDCFYFGFCNRVRSTKNEISKSNSDVKLFEEQMSAHKRNRSTDSGIDFAANANGGDSSEIDLESMRDDDSDCKTESVLLRVKCDENGQIETQIYSIGRDRLELSFTAPKLDVERLISKGSFSSGIRTKYMTTYVISLISWDAYFIDRTDPKQAFAVEAFPNPERGLVAAVQAKLRLSPAPEERRLRGVPIDCSLGIPPTEGAIWSTVQAGSNSAFVCVQDTESLLCSLWKLELEEELEPEEPVTPRHFEVPDQVVEVHSSVDGEDQRRPSPIAESPSANHRTLIRIGSDGNVLPKLLENDHAVRSPSQNSQLSSIVRCAGAIRMGYVLLHLSGIFKSRTTEAAFT
ncbi:unnamed protein product [Toxocara canis]|uniref:NudC domain-containing protein 1 n=1 Tax=Toxocara canis TaxID=6265 RepID=A0A183UKC6_TOXCA|nr:unnamed protein product [Toxocara canis]